MKNLTVRILLAVVLLIGFGVTPVLADGGNPLPCGHGIPCAISK